MFEVLSLGDSNFFDLYVEFFVTVNAFLSDLIDGIMKSYENVIHLRDTLSDGGLLSILPFWLTASVSIVLTVCLIKTFLGVSE